MATKKKSTAQGRSARQSGNASSDASAKRAWRTLKDAIETERGRLMTADAILHGVVVAMDADDHHDPDSPDYQTLVALARDLVKQTIDQLDSVRLKPMVQKTGKERAK